LSTTPDKMSPHYFVKYIQHSSSLHPIQITGYL